MNLADICPNGGKARGVSHNRKASAICTEIFIVVGNSRFVGSNNVALVFVLNPTTHSEHAYGEVAV
jgi:hypothetical protein